MVPQDATVTQLLRSVVYFPVADVEQAVSHYQRVLGFHCDYVAGTPPGFAVLSRDSLSINRDEHE
jgi:hypothetical protein